MISLSLDVKSAAAVRQVLFDEQKLYTYDPESVPLRIIEIRNVINNLDEGIQKELEKEWSMINLKMNMNDAVLLRHTLFMYTKDHPGFFSDDGILKIRKISQQLDKEIDKEFEESRNEKWTNYSRRLQRIWRRVL